MEFRRTYVERINGERIENLEHAIKHFNNVFLVYKLETAPYSWAMNHVDLARAYWKRLRGTGDDNQEKAIYHLREALRVLDRTRFAVDWATVHHLLGIIYYAKVSGDKAANYEKSIAHLQNALLVRTPNNVATSWAESMNSLGNTYKDRINGVKIDNQEKAIACYTPIPGVIKPAVHPQLWAVVQYNFGLVYAQRQTGNPTENTTSAIRLFQNALTVQTPTVNPIECFKIASNLGSIFYNSNRYTEAINALELCHQSAENMRLQSARENTRKQIAAECGEMYAKLVYSCLSIKDNDRAFYYASAAKARVFSDKLGSLMQQPEKMLRDKHSFNVSWKAISNLRQEIDMITSQREFLYTKGEALAEDGRTLASILNAKRDELATLLDEVFFNFPELSRTTDAPIADPEKIKQLAKELGNIPLIEYYKNEKGWGAFVVHRDKIEYEELPGVSADLIEAIKKCVVEYEQGVLAKKDPAFFATNLHIHLSTFYKSLVEPLLAFLPFSGPIVIAPAHDLHLLPFNIAFDTVKKTYLVDKYTITYIPSLGALHTLFRQLKIKMSSKNENRLLSVVYSASEIGSPLPNAIKEARIIAD